MRASLPLLLLLWAFPALATDTPDLTPVRKWLAQADDLHTVQADFTQTRALRTLRSPIVTPGHLWFSAPDSLRWELGDPARTIVLRKGPVYFLIQPAKKKAERFAAESIGKQNGPQAFAMMNFPIARDFADYNRQFETLAVTASEGRCHLELLPRDAQSRKFLAAIKIDFETATGRLRSFEFVTRDGSSMRNDFTDVQMNRKFDRSVFEYDFSGYEIVDAKN